MVVLATQAGLVLVVLEDLVTSMERMVLLALLELQVALAVKWDYDIVPTAMDEMVTRESREQSALNK